MSNSPTYAQPVPTAAGIEGRSGLAQRVGRQWRFLGEVLLVAAVFIGAFLVFSQNAEHGTFYGDESRYIWRSRYFDHLFLRHDLGHSEWSDSYWTHTQPMVSHYIIGGWLWLRGYDLWQLPLPYDWGRTVEENWKSGRVPDDVLLGDARAPMLAIATAAVVVVYLLGRMLGGPLAGLGAAVFVLGSPLATVFLVRAWSEAPLIFLMLLSLLIGVLGARRGRTGGLPIKWALALGIVLGLAFGTKLTALLSLSAVFGWGALVTVVAAVGRSGPLSSRVQAGWSAARGWMLALVVGLAVFVLSNPHLYRNPILHTSHLFQSRAREMMGQQRARFRSALHNPLDRPAFVVGRSLFVATWSGSRGLPLEAVLATVGGGVLLVGSWRGWHRTGRAPAEGLVMMTVLTYFVGVSAGLLLAWPKYVLPTFMLGTLLSGLGLSAIVRQLASLRPAALRARSLPQDRMAAPAARHG